MQKKKFIDTKFKEQNGEILIGISNDNGEILYVPKKYIDIYVNCPDQLFSKLARTVEIDRELEIGINEEIPLDDDDIERSVKITNAQKGIFFRAEDTEEEILFPELVHDQYVELEGHITRGNENSNTIGLEYKKHILTCYPDNGNISRYKNLLFTNSIVKGFIDRRNIAGELIEKRPKIRFLDIIEIEDNIKQLKIFDKE